jgi:DNA-binding CsgD family transcriptional regulator
MKDTAVAAPVTIAVDIGDPLLASRLRAALAGVVGVRLVGGDQPADVILAQHVTDADEAEAGLTPREVEVLNLLAEGASNKTIARRLGISVHTAKFHVGSLLDKLDASGRTDAVTHAVRRGYIDL